MIHAYTKLMSKIYAFKSKNIYVQWNGLKLICKYQIYEQKL